jgi:uncharacterized protein YdeI (YjbR/CyaY-like superfamily)
LSGGEELYVADRWAWRLWLQGHHVSSLGVLLAFYKKETGRPSIPYDDAIEGALCYGWVDSQIRRIDSDRFARRFTPRRPGSNWSKSNVERARRLIGEGWMVEAGLLQVREAKRRGTCSAPESKPRGLQVPTFLVDALEANPTAALNFQRMAPSYKEQFTAWVANAKTESTRRKRVLETLDKLERNEKLGLK